MAKPSPIVTVATTVGGWEVPALKFGGAGHAISPVLTQTHTACPRTIIVQNRRFQVIGSGAVYIVDGSGVTHSNIAEARPERTLSMHGVYLHVLSAGNAFDLVRKLPSPEEG